MDKVTLQLSNFKAANWLTQADHSKIRPKTVHFVQVWVEGSLRLFVVQSLLSRTCRDQKQPVVIEFNSQIAVALTHVSDFVKSCNQREREVREAVEVVLTSDQGLVTK